jgi:Ras-related protein Rab-18
VSTEEGEAFAERMNSLFVEASAKTAVGVQEAFRAVVEKVLDTPELWAPPTPVVPTTAKSMPGTVDLSDDASAQPWGCSC